MVFWLVLLGMSLILASHLDFPYQSTALDTDYSSVTHQALDPSWQILRDPRGNRPFPFVIKYRLAMPNSTLCKAGIGEYEVAMNDNYEECTRLTRPLLDDLIHMALPHSHFMNNQNPSEPPAIQCFEKNFIMTPALVRHVDPVHFVFNSSMTNVTVLFNNNSYVWDCGDPVFYTHLFYSPSFQLTIPSSHNNVTITKRDKILTYSGWIDGHNLDNLKFPEFHPDRQALTLYSYQGLSTLIVIHPEEQEQYQRINWKLSKEAVQLMLHLLQDSVAASLLDMFLGQSIAPQSDEYTNPEYGWTRISNTLVPGGARFLAFRKLHPLELQAIDRDHQGRQLRGNQQGLYEIICSNNAVMGFRVSLKELIETKNVFHNGYFVSPSVEVNRGCFVKFPFHVLACSDRVYRFTRTLVEYHIQDLNPLAFVYRGIRYRFSHNENAVVIDIIQALFKSGPFKLTFVLENDKYPLTIKRAGVSKPVQIFGGIKVKKDSDPSQLSNHLSRVIISPKDQMLVGKYLHNPKQTMAKRVSSEYVRILTYLANFMDLKPVLMQNPIDRHL